MAGSLAEALEHLVRGVVDHPDEVRVDSRDTARGELLEVRVHPRDLGRVIGRGGRTAYARLQQEFVPASLAVIDFDVAGWDSIAEQTGALERFAAPRS